MDGNTPACQTIIIYIHKGQIIISNTLTAREDCTMYYVPQFLENIPTRSPHTSLWI